MTRVPDGKQAYTDGSIESDLVVSSPITSASSLSVLARYYFNLTDGETMIRDEEGLKASCVQAAMVSAMVSVEELRSGSPELGCVAGMAA
jgi:hypothetical protein